MYMCKLKKKTNFATSKPKRTKKKSKKRTNQKTKKIIQNNCDFS